MQPLEVLHGSSIGQHVRHIIDFYKCILDGSFELTIDYAKRERRIEVETIPAAAINAFQEVLFGLRQQPADQALRVLGDYSGQQDRARESYHSSVGREMMFAHDHAVHHLAIIKIAVCSCFSHIKLPKNLGIAPATIRHQQTGTSS